MRRTLIVVLAAIVVLAGFAPAAAGAVSATTAQEESSCDYPIELTDATGEEIELDEPPERVVALMPSDAQTAFEVGAADRVVGMPVSPTTDALEAGDRTDVTEDDGFTVDPEVVVGLEPDVVLAGNTTPMETLDQLRESGLTVYHFSTAESVGGVLENVERTGQLTGECDGAEATATWVDERLDLLGSAVEDEDHPLAYYEMGGGYTPGPGSFQHEILVTAGLENVAERAGIDGWQIISPETVVDEDPEWIVYGAGPEEPPVPETVQSTTAFEQENFAAIDSNNASQPGPYVVYAVEELVSIVHPDAHESVEADLADVDERYEAGEFLPEDESDDESAGEDSEDDDASDDSEDENAGDDEETEDSIPGFGAAAGVAALVLAIVIAANRR